MISFFKKKAVNPTIQSYVQTLNISKNTLIKDLEFLVLDFETTGLNHKKDNIVSMGWVVINNLSIDFKTSRHIIINPKDKLTQQSICIHKLTHDKLMQGEKIKKAMDQLITAMKNRVLVVHFKHIEKKFINEVCSKIYNINKLPMIIVDTLDIQLKRNKLLNINEQADNLRLFNLRNYYNLPRYKAHNAMLDAVATAELFLAQISWKGDIYNITLKEVL